jgi:hypothetical protein
MKDDEDIEIIVDELNDEIFEYRNGVIRDKEIEGRLIRQWEQVLSLVEGVKEVSATLNRGLMELRHYFGYGV